MQRTYISSLNKHATIEIDIEQLLQIIQNSNPEKDLGELANEFLNTNGKYLEQLLCCDVLNDNGKKDDVLLHDIYNDLNVCINAQFVLHETKRRLSFALTTYEGEMITQQLLEKIKYDVYKIIEEVKQDYHIPYADIGVKVEEDYGTLHILYYIE